MDGESSAGRAIDWRRNEGRWDSGDRQGRLVNSLGSVTLLTSPRLRWTSTTRTCPVRRRSHRDESRET